MAYLSISHWGMFPVHIHEWDNIIASDDREAYICRGCLKIEERQRMEIHEIFAHLFKDGKAIPKHAASRSASLPQHPVKEWIE